MRTWDLRSAEVEPHEPQIISSDGDARVVVLHLAAGEELQEHEVHERARIVIIEGEAEIARSGGQNVRATSGHLFEFDPGERHTVVAQSDTRLLLLLTPWPGDGHPGALTLERKAEVRELAAQHVQR